MRTPEEARRRRAADTITADALGAAARWWADRLRDGAGVGDNGGRDPQNNAARRLANVLRNSVVITEGMCARFEAELLDKLVRWMTGHPTGHHAPSYYERVCRGDDGALGLEIEIDYHATGMLLCALIAAGVDPVMADSYVLPLKTRMEIYPSRVLVRHGAAALAAQIWPLAEE